MESCTVYNVHGQGPFSAAASCSINVTATSSTPQANINLFCIVLPFSQIVGSIIITRQHTGLSILHYVSMR